MSQSSLVDSQDLKYWLLLHSIQGIGPITFKRLLEKFSSPVNVFSAKIEELQNIPRLSRKSVSEILAAHKKLYEIEELLSVLRKRQFRIVTLFDSDYPSKLKRIRNAPPILYVFGELGHKKCISIIGARDASPIGLKLAFKFAQELAEMGFTIVSGYAKGVDTQAHLGAIVGGGSTIMVLAMGILRFVLHEELEAVRKQLLERSTIISEFFPRNEWTAGQAMARNRITSGLADAVLVVEAGKKSGTITTAKWGIEQGKPIFLCEPVRDDREMELVEMGATLVKGPEEIIKRLTDLAL
jgi:DNA processing protein